MQQNLISVRFPSGPRTRARAQYVLDWVAEHPYAGERIRFVEVGGDVVSPQLDIAAVTGGTAWFDEACDDRTTLSVFGPRLCYAVQQGTKIYGIGWASSTEFYANGAFAFDWFSSLFYWLSCWQERSPKVLSVNPPISKAQWLVRHGLEREPRADRLVAAVLRTFGMEPMIGPSTVFMTHDLDHVRQYQRPWSGLRFVNYVRRKGAARGALLDAVKREWRSETKAAHDPFDNPEQTLRDRGGVLYLLLGRHVRADGGSDRTDKALQNWLSQAAAHGMSVGIHPSYTVATHPERMGVELERFRQLCGRAPIESRQHYLRWDWASTPQLLARLGIETDSSLGYRDRLGFRCGTSFRYRLYDFDAENSFRLAERPLAAMDTAWMERNDWNPTRCREDWVDFITLNARGAQLVVNIHNSSYPLANALGIELDSLRQVCPFES